MKRVSVLIGAASLAILGVALATGIRRSNGGQAQTFPVTPTIGAPTTGDPPRRGEPPPLPPKELFNTTVQVAMTMYESSRGSGDPANGRTRLGTAWVQIGPTGIAERFHLISTYEDGAFHQEILADRNDTTVVVERSRAIQPPNQPASCVTRTPTDASYLRSIVPLFATGEELARTGFRDQREQASTRPRPTTTISPGVTPLRVFASSPTVSRWVRAVATQAGSSSESTVELTPEGRVQLTRQVELDSQGRAINEMWTSYGPLVVQDSAKAPATAFRLTQEGCHA